MTAGQVATVKWWAMRCTATVLVVVGAPYVARGLVGLLRNAPADLRRRG